MRASASVALFWPGVGRADPNPTVRGPDDGQGTLGVVLPGPASRPLERAIDVKFEGECLQPELLTAGVARWLEQDRVSDRVSIAVSGEQSPTLGARFWLLVDGQRASLRRFEDFAGTCEELLSSLSAAVALAIEAVDFSNFPVPEPPKPCDPAAFDKKNQ